MASASQSEPRTTEWILRALLAGPATLILAIAIIAAMPVWFPEGAGGVGHVIFPPMLFPAVWGAAFFYALLEKKLWRAGLVFGMLIALNIVLAASTGGWT